MKKNFKDFLNEKLQDEMELNEVKFSEKKLLKVATLYAKIMGKRMGGEFKLYGLEDFKRKSGAGKGYRFMNNKGAQLRLNWDSRKAKKAQFELTSIDYWDINNIDMQKPTRTVTFSPDLNTMQVLGKITEALLTGSVHEAQEIIDSANLIVEKRAWADRNQFMLDADLPASNPTEKNMRKIVADRAPHLSEQLEVFLGQPESNSAGEALDKAEKIMDATIYADPETIFNELEDLTQMVAGRFTKSLVITGMGGIGKTFHVTEGPRSLLKTLGQSGEQWELITAPKASMSSFYKDCYTMRDKIIVWDECDALFMDSDIMTALKGALDTSGENFMSYGMGTERMVGKNTKEVITRALEIDMDLADGKEIGPGKDQVMLPAKFQFSGSMIFISNMKIEKFRKVDTGGALMSRSLFIDIYLEATDVIKRIKTIGYAMASGGAKYTAADIDEIVDALSEAEGDSSPLVKNGIQYATAGTSRSMKGISVRSMVQALKMKVEMKLPNWKELAQKYA